MLRKFQAPLVLLVCLVSVSAAAQEPAAEGSSEPAPPGTPPPPAPPPAAPPEATAPPPSVVATPAMPAGPTSDWHIELHGYFRAPTTIGISSRPGPDDQAGPSKTQYSYGPNRTVDSFYYSFAYTRLQEQDWAELFVHAKKPHVDAALGWMGYWFQGAGFRNYDAAWAPGLAYLALDTDFEAAGLTPNITFTAGAFWPGFGYFEKYDTYTLGRFRQMGGQLKLTVPWDDFKGVLTAGLGTNRDGSFSVLAPAFLGAITSLDLLTYVNLQVTHKKYFDAGIHFNTEWTADPNNTKGIAVSDKSYQQAALAHLSVVGGEVTLRIPNAGRLWISPSYISVRNGWALGAAGTEVMHSLGGFGVASNYLAYTGNPPTSTGSGTIFNLGLLYELKLSDTGLVSPGLGDWTLSLFGLLANASLDLPPPDPDPAVPPSGIATHLNQLKYGADLTYQALTWMGAMLRYDGVNYDRDLPGYVFAAITGRVFVSSHFMSSERIYLQYSRYIYGDNFTLGGVFPWENQPLVYGSDVLQQGPYRGKKGDASVVKLQAEIAF